MKNLNIIIEPCVRRMWLEEVRNNPLIWKTTLMVAPAIVTNIAMGNEALEQWSPEMEVVKKAIAKNRREVRAAYEKANRIEATLTGFMDLWRHCYLRFYLKEERQNYFAIQVDVPSRNSAGLPPNDGGFVYSVHIQKWNGKKWVHLK